MTQEEKQLLLTDICTRLPYHNLWVQYDNKDWLAIGYGHGRIELLPNPFSSIAGPCPMIEDIKPYLRPLSSMTEEERGDWYRQSKVDYDCEFKPEPTLSVENCHLSVDWLIANHFDYRGLIEKGLALEAPEGMYKTE